MNATIKRWFNGLDEFDGFVHSQLLHHFKDQLGHGQLSFHNIALIQFPLLWSALEHSAAKLRIGDAEGALDSALCAVWVCLLFYPIVIVCVIRVAALCQKRRKSRAADLAVSAGLALFTKLALIKPFHAFSVFLVTRCKLRVYRQLLGFVLLGPLVVISVRRRRTRHANHGLAPPTGRPLNFCQPATSLAWARHGGAAESLCKDTLEMAETSHKLTEPWQESEHPQARMLAAMPGNAA